MTTTNRLPENSAVLDFYMGSYSGYVGQKRPMIEMTHKSGAVLRFLAFARGSNIDTIWIKADGECTMTKRELVDAENLFVSAQKKGYIVTLNRAGE